MINRIFGILKSHFTVLKLASPFLFNRQVELVLTYVALHIFLCKECRFDEFLIESVDESSFSVLLVNKDYNFEHII
uniref:DDE Tnp4 domain-containing protein n=1 Tax=Cajanus cajan TaxID=3821 RepID=A0A151S803_CAJCA|nr:hypothetical protein KK1_027306 [Cajanus cajan]